MELERPPAATPPDYGISESGIAATGGSPATNVSWDVVFARSAETGLEPYQSIRPAHRLPGACCRDRSLPACWLLPRTDHGAAERNDDLPEQRCHHGLKVVRYRGHEDCST